MGEKRVKILISGKVQGVSFRVSTLEKAKEFNLKGWVKNLSDGKVLILAEGEEEKLKKLINWTKEGPPLAEVERIKISWQKAKRGFKDFKIIF